MIKMIVLATVLLLTGAVAQAADVQMGSVTLKLPPPEGYCELDRGQASDKRMIDFLDTALSKGPNELLAISADCGELRDWRARTRPLLEHFSQYQVEKVRRSVSFATADAKGACEVMRAQGQKLSDSSTRSVADDIHAANAKIDFQGQTFLGILGDDPNGCYVGLYQKYKAETGKQLSQLNVFFAGSIKDREVFFYAWAPYQDDKTINGLLSLVQAQVRSLKAANGL